LIRVEVHNDIPEALGAFSTGLQAAMVDSVNEMRDRIASHAVVLYMRDASGARSPDGRFLPRSPGDSGPLRILSGRLGTSILGTLVQGGVSPDTIYELTPSPTEVRLKWGSRTPYANIHERGGVAGRGAVIPPRPYIGPATDDLRPEFPVILDTRIQALATEVGL